MKKTTGSRRVEAGGTGRASRGRRRVLGILGLAGLVPLALAGTRAAADEVPKPGPLGGAGPASGAAEGPSQDARDLAKIARRRYGAHLDGDQVRELTEEIDDNLKSAERLRKVKLTNADEPDVVFRAEG